MKAQSGDTHEPEKSRRYWIMVVMLVVFGFITGFSIGIPFLLLGLVLAVVGPFRAHPMVVWPVIFAWAAFVGVFVMISPLSCSGSASNLDPVGRTTCSNLLGIDYSGSGNYNPSQLPALMAALTAAGLAGLLGVWIFRRSARPFPPIGT